MKKRPRSRSRSAAAPVADEHEPPLPADPDRECSDLCQTLLDRYAKSSASQHLHLCATACAMRSLLSDAGLPLTPPSYFAAALNAIRDADPRDSVTLSSLSSFLSALLPHVPLGSVPPSDLKHSLASTVVPILRCTSSNTTLPATAVRSLVSTLGFLVLGLDPDDWTFAKPPIETLLTFAIDQRPKVRKIAQLYVGKSFVCFKDSPLGRRYRKLVVSTFKEHASSAASEGAKASRCELLHMLQVVKILIPEFPMKIVTVLLWEVFGISRLVPSLHVLPLLEVLLKFARIDDLVSEFEKIVGFLTSGDSVSRDTAGLVSSSLSIVLDRVGRVNPGLCIASLPKVFGLLTDLLSFGKDDAAECVSEMLKELINGHVDKSLFWIDDVASKDSSLLPKEAKAMWSLCGLLEEKIRSCSGVPNVHILAVVSDMFLKLGEFSGVALKDVILELGQRTRLVQETPEIGSLQECVGAAIVAIGPEKMLQLFPISLDEEEMICSNAWLIPLLRKYVSGASLGFFMEHIVPLVKHLKKKCRKGKGTPAVKGLRLCIRGLWDLLPAFCHYSKDTSQCFGSLAKLLVDSLKEDASLHKQIAMALQVIVKENKQVQATNNGVNDLNVTSSMHDELNSFGLRQTDCPYSKSETTKNLEAVTASSVVVFDALVSSFLKASSETQLHLMGAIECLTPFVGAEHLQKSFNFLLQKFSSKGISIESDVSISDAPLSNGDERKRCTKDDGKIKVIMKLACCLIGEANEDLINDIYNYIKPFILAKGEGGYHEVYLVLCKILKEHNWFCAEKIDELLNLLTSGKPSDAKIYRAHLSCFHFLLIYVLKNDDEEEKAFLILNEIILALKDSDKEFRAAAYDLLIEISGNFKDSMLTFPGSPSNKLLEMIMGYFSGASSKITSGAVAALSLLVYKNADVCVSVPSLLPSILALLQRKENDIVKACLGFVKVLVSSLEVSLLNRFLSDVVKSILPWSSISKFHFRTKVKIIFEIMMRRCGTVSVNAVVPEKFREFVRGVKDNHGKKTGPSVPGSTDVGKVPGDLPIKENRKRKYKHLSDRPGDGHHARTSEKKSKKSTASNVQRQKQNAGGNRKKNLFKSRSSTGDKSRRFRGNAKSERIGIGKNGRKGAKGAKVMDKRKQR